jgi:hypothetical protein
MAKKKSGGAYAGFFLSFEHKRTEFIAQKLWGEGEASESFSAFDWELDRRELAMLSLTPGRTCVDALVLMERMHGSGGTGKLKMRLHKPVLLERALEAQELAEVFNVEGLRSTAEQLKRFSPAEWTAAIDAIKRLRPKYSGEIESLIQAQRQANPWLGRDVRTLRLSEQRDALGLVFDIADVDRKSLFRRARTEGVSEASSILDLLDSERMHEQDVMRHDENVFPGLLSGEMSSARFRDLGGREVRVHVYDKKPLETVLGIDLLIYQEAYKSFALIQYKTMEQAVEAKGKSWSYLADEQLWKQMQAMQDAEDAIRRIPQEPPGLMDWRLRDEAFFFKFCETTRPDARDDALVRGITMCHSQLRHFLELPESDSKRGGKRIGYENCPRYLNNTQFVDLASSGWIGCGPQGYHFIRQVLEAGTDGGRAAMLAVVKGEQTTSALSRATRW